MREAQGLVIHLIFMQFAALQISLHCIQSMLPGDRIQYQPIGLTFMRVEQPDVSGRS